MIYAVVLFGSLIGIVGILGYKLLIRNRSVRRFVRSMQQRLRNTQDRGAVLLEETAVDKPRKDPRTSAIEMQEVRTLLRTAEKHLAQEQHDEAERCFIQALTIHPDDIDVQAQLAKLYLVTKREPKAEALYKDILQKKEDVSFFANLGLAYYNQEKYIEACQAYQEALNRDPKNAERSAALGRACIAAERFEEASALLEKACERLNRDTTLMHLLAECYLQIGDTAKAEATYRKINKLEPYDEEVKKKLTNLAKD